MLKELLQQLQTGAPNKVCKTKLSKTQARAGRRVKEGPLVNFSQPRTRAYLRALNLADFNYDIKRKPLLSCLIFQFSFHVMSHQRIKFTGAGKIVVPSLRECCRQVEAEEVSNSRNKIHQTWGPQFCRPLYCHCAGRRQSWDDIAFLIC